MSSVQEITTAVDKLAPKDLQEVGLFVLRRLREKGSLPPVRRFSKEQIEGWIAEDEREMAALRASE